MSSLALTGGMMHLVGALFGAILIFAAYKKYSANPGRYWKFLVGVLIYTAVFAVSGVMLLLGIISEPVFVAFSFLRALAILLITLAIMGV